MDLIYAIVVCTAAGNCQFVEPNKTYATLAACKMALNKKLVEYSQLADYKTTPKVDIDCYSRPKDNDDRL